jgi:hypothetical protein
VKVWATLGWHRAGGSPSAIVIYHVLKVGRLLCSAEAAETLIAHEVSSSSINFLAGKLEPVDRRFEPLSILPGVILVSLDQIADDHSNVFLLHSTEVTHLTSLPVVEVGKIRLVYPYRGTAARSHSQGGNGLNLNGERLLTDPQRCIGGEVNNQERSDFIGQRQEDCPLKNIAQIVKALFKERCYPALVRLSWFKKPQNYLLIVCLCSLDCLLVQLGLFACAAWLKCVLTL